jgi:eukaryotic-like serine/threonine-protein kinase
VRRLEGEGSVVHSCPTAETLARLGFDSLLDARSSSLDDHIDNCMICQGRLEQLVENDKAPQGAGSGFVPVPDVPPEIPGFEIERELGRGGMSVVYQARQPSLNRRVALKVVRSGPAGSHDRARWLREARSIARVRHDNVVRLYQVGEANGWLYLVLDLVPGGSLETRLENPYEAKDAARLLASVARTVAAIHGAGILHLDLKPSNILLDGPPELPRELATPRVSDFGIAFPWNDPDTIAGMTVTGGPMGTPRYMAPEQLGPDRAAIGPAADIYGLGGLLYHALTGRPPFAAPSLVDMLEQVRNQDPVPPRNLNASIPRDIETICLKCLQKEPRRRYVSAEALADDLDRWLEGRPIVARATSPLERVWRWCRLKPIVAGLATALVLTLSISFVVVLVLWRQAEAQRSRAEAERRKAEADYHVARIALTEILDLGGTGVESGESLERPELDGSLQNARDRILELADGREEDPSFWTLLALVDHFLGGSLHAKEKWPEAQALCEESLIYWEKILSLNASDQNALRSRWMTSIYLASALEKQGYFDRSVRVREQTIAYGDALGPLLRGTDLDRMAGSRVGLAQLLLRLGDRQGAERLLRENIRRLSDKTIGNASPKIALRLLWTRQELARSDSSDVERPFDQLVPAEKSEPYFILFSPESERLSAREWAERAVTVVRSIAGREEDAAQVARIGREFNELLYYKASYARHDGRLDVARKTADRMLAFARALVAKFPGQSASHLALSLAYAQFYKNASRVDDRPAVETNMRLALASAENALLVDVKDNWSRRAVAQLQEKLKRFCSSR